METSTQSQSVLPTPMPAAQSTSSSTTSAMSTKKNNIPLILSILALAAIVIILAVLYMVSQNNVPEVTVNPEPVISEEFPEVNPSPVATIPGATVYEGKLFNVAFEYTGDITTDITTLETYLDGTSKCLQEEMTGTDLEVNIVQGEDCVNNVGVVYDVSDLQATSKDGKEFTVSYYGANGENASAIFRGKTPEGVSVVLKIEFTALSTAEVGAKVNTLIPTLSFDTTTALKSDITDEIVSE